MNLEVFNVWNIGFWALLAGAVAWLWRIGSSKTAKWSLVGAVVITVGSTIWGNTEFSNIFAEDANPDIKAFAESVNCISCSDTETPNGYNFRARLITGTYSFSLTREMPYALRYEGGEVLLDDRPLPKECSIQTMPTSSRMEFKGARVVRLEVGDSAKCR